MVSVTNVTLRNIVFFDIVNMTKIAKLFSYADVREANNRNTNSILESNIIKMQDTKVSNS